MDEFALMHDAAVRDGISVMVQIFFLYVFLCFYSFSFCLFAYLCTFCAHDNKHNGLKIHTRVNAAGTGSIILDRCASYVAFPMSLLELVCVRHYRNRCAETFVSVSALRDLLGLHSKKINDK